MWVGPRETGLILRCAGKAGNPFQTTQGNRLSCRRQEGRRGSEDQAWKPGSQHAGEKRGVAGLLLGMEIRALKV